MKIKEKIENIHSVAADLRSLGYKYASELLKEHADLLESIDKVEPVGEIIKYPHNSFSIPIVTVDLPVGTKLYAHPPKQEQNVFEALKTKMQTESDYAWAWHCNIAMAIYDKNLTDHYTANQCAATIMKMLFEVEPAHTLPKQEQSPVEDGTEFERFLTQNSRMAKLRYGPTCSQSEVIDAAEDIALEAWQAARKLSAPEVVSKTTDTVVPDDLKEICGLIARIFFYGNFTAETYNERELEKLLRKTGYFAETEDELMGIISRLPSSNA